MKFLVCDDSKMARKMLIKTLVNLTNENNEIIEASNGLEAVEAHKNFSPDLIFMDLTMPKMNGFEAVKNICEIDKDAKIIVISADIQEGSMKKVKENGALGFIKKPVNEESLKQVLMKLKAI